MAYIYQADVYCDDCGQAIKAKCPKPNYPQPWDTDDYPASASEDEPTDSPQHCGGCHVPLDNPLTDEGLLYVLEAIEEAMTGPESERNRIMPKPGTGEDCESFAYWHGSRHVDILRGWAEKARDCALACEESTTIDCFLRWTEAPQ